MSFSHHAAIALGSNLGDSYSTLNCALKTLNKHADICVESQSKYYKTTAVGPPQPDYLNACAILSTNLAPRSLLRTLLDIEEMFGRERRERWGPRTLDLDLLLFDNEVIEEPGLIVPHPHMTERAFVLIPLTEIASNWVHPVKQQSVAQLVNAIDGFGIASASESNSCISVSDPVL